MEETLMNFSEALVELRNGKKVRNVGWNHEGSYIEIQNPDENSKMTEAYIYFTWPSEEKNDYLIPWVASQFDILRGQWEVVE